MTLTRPTRVMIAANTMMQNSDRSQPATVDLDDGGGPCLSASIIPPKSEETVSCAGAIWLKAGSYHLGIYASAQGTKTPGVAVSAEHASVVWWTLPPSKH